MLKIAILGLVFLSCARVGGPGSVPSPNTYTVNNNGSGAYRFSGNGVNSSADDPTLTFTRGETYTLNITTSGTHPFFIKTAISSGSNDAYNDGVSNNGATTGSITFTVPAGAPSTLLYQCGLHTTMAGTINIVD